MTKLLVMMLFIALTLIYTGVILTLFINSSTWTWYISLRVANAIVNIVYEINTILITWIVGF